MSYAMLQGVPWLTIGPLISDWWLWLESSAVHVKQEAHMSAS